MRFPYTVSLQTMAFLVYRKYLLLKSRIEWIYSFNYGVSHDTMTIEEGLGVNIPMYDKYAKATSSVVNHDFNMRKFVYKVNMSKEEIISSLKIMNIKDDLSCAFNFEKNTVIFTDLSYLKPGYETEYFYEIQEYDGFSILKLSVTSIFHERNNIYLKLNPFMVSKINAEIVPFSKYGK